MKYFKWLSLTLVVMMFTLIGAPLVTQSANAQEDDKTYIIATDTTFAPFEYQDEQGEYVGIDMDLLKAIAEDQGFKYEIRPLGFNAALQAVEAGQIDGMIAGMSITDERRESFDFSDPYYQAGVQFAVLDNSDIKSLEELKGQKVAVKSGTQGMTVAEEVADEYGFTVTIFEDSINMYEDLQAGNSQALIEDKPVMAYAAETGGFPLRFIGEQMEVSDFGFAVMKDQNTELIEMFNKGLANLKASGEYDEIIATYVGSDETEEETADESNDDLVVADPDTTYVIGTDTTFAPFEFQDENGDFVGIDMDLLAAIAEDQGFNYEIRPLGFNAALQAVEAGQVDGMIAGMSITDERRQSFDFSETYFSAGVQFAVLEDSDYQALEDLDGENIAVKTGTQGMAVAESLADEYGFTITTFEDSVNMYEDLQAGNSSAVIEDYPVMAYAAETGGIPLRFIGDQMEVADYGFAVKKDQNDDLIALFNQGLTNIQASGQYDEIVANYLGGSTTEEGEVATTNPFVQLIQTNGKALLNGLWTTLWVTLVSFAIAAVLGIVVGLMRTSGVGILSVIAQIYIDIMRGMPLIVLAFFIYFGIPQLTGLQFGAYAAGITTLSLNAAAYIAEIVRGGINAVDKGQTEAARSLGLNQSKTMQRIILPQAFRIMIPSFINQFVITLKDTSILSVIGLVELTQTGRIIIARTYQSGAMWLIVGLMYIILITILTKISNRLEKEL